MLFLYVNLLAWSWAMFSLIVVGLHKPSRTTYLNKLKAKAEESTNKTMFYSTVIFYRLFDIGLFLALYAVLIFGLYQKYIPYLIGTCTMMYVIVLANSKNKNVQVGSAILTLFGFVSLFLYF